MQIPKVMVFDRKGNTMLIEMKEISNKEILKALERRKDEEVQIKQGEV